METLSLEVLLAAAGILVGVLIYFATVQRNKLQADDTISASERLAIRTRIIEEYAAKYERRHDAGPHLLATLGLPQLRSDHQIREVIESIRQRTGHDPWEGAGNYVDGIDLLTLFDKAAKDRVDFLRVPVNEFVNQLVSNKTNTA